MEGKKFNKTLTSMWRYKWFYVMFAPVFLIVTAINYLPMLGIRFAFYKYNPFTPVPKWIGMENFERLWSSDAFWNAFRNTLILSLSNLALSMVLSVTIALLINEIVFDKTKKTFQTIVYLPHFLSWVVTASVFMLILSPQTGMVNAFLMKFGFINEPIYFLADLNWWRPTYLFISRWKETGWGTVIFLATLAGISPELYEAAGIDGAGRWKQTLYITLPSIMDTFFIVLILNLAKVLNLFESVLVLYNAMVYPVADVLQTYIYRISIVAPSPEYGYSTAVGLFKSLITCFLVLGSNYASGKVRGRGIM